MEAEIRVCLHCHKSITKGCRVRVTEIPKRDLYPSFYFDLCEQCRRAMDITLVSPVPLMKFLDQKTNNFYNQFIDFYNQFIDFKEKLSEEKNRRKKEVNIMEPCCDCPCCAEKPCGTKCCDKH